MQSIRQVKNFFSKITGLSAFGIGASWNLPNIDEEKVEMLKRLGSELSFNYVKAGKIYEHRGKYLSINEFTASKYKTEDLAEFYKRRLFAENEQFPYTRLLALIDKLESDNQLRDSVFSTTNYQVQYENKLKFLENTIQRRSEIVNLMNLIEKFYKKFGLVLTEYT